MISTTPIGLDFETVGGITHPGEDCKDKQAWQEWSRSMHPARGGHVRLVQLSFHDEPDQIIDLYAEGITLVDLKDALESQGPYVCHHAGFEQLFLRDAGIRVTTYDTMILDGMLRAMATPYEDDVGVRMYRSLNDVAQDHLGEQKAGDEQSSDWSQALTQQQYQYAMKDAVLVRDMWPTMLNQMPEAFHPGVEMMMDAVGPLAEVNLHGLYADDNAHKLLTEQLTSEAAAMRQELIASSGIENPASGKQVTEMLEQLFEQILGEVWRLAIPWVRTKNGQLLLSKPYVTSKLKEVEDISPDIAQWLRARIAWRGKSKLAEAFGETMRRQQDDDGRYRGEYKLGGAVTGRMSCAKPNLQQIPAKTDPRFREMFLAYPGRKLVIADYAQIELRVAGLASNDPAFEHIFANGLDIHSETAAKMFNVPKPTDTQRKAAKAVNFGTLYGATAPTISLSSGFSHAEAEEFLHVWMTEAFPTYARWTEVFKVESRQRGHFTTAGKRRILVDPRAAPTKLKNFPIQGSAADILYHALILTDQALHDAKIDAKVIALIHDEFILDSHEDCATEAGAILVRCMTQGLQACYPDAFVGDLVDAAVVDTWAEKP